MSVDTSNIPKSLIDALKAGEVVPFVGAGVSRAVEKKEKDSAKTFNPLFPGWKEFLDLASEKLIGEKNLPAAEDITHLLKLSRPKYLEAAQIAYDSLGVPLWNKLLREIFEVDEDKADSESLELARLVWQIGSNLVFTTNIDEVLEWKAVKDEKINILDTQTDEFPELQRKETIKPTLIYLHGRIRDKANIVFTLEQYKDFYERQKNTAKLETLHSFLARKTFLFIGFSLDDPYFAEQIEYIHKTYNGASDFFYVLVKNEEKGKLSHLSYVKEVEYKKFGEPLLEVMREMRDIAGKTKNGEKNEKPLPVTPENALKNHFNVPFASKGDAFVGREGLCEKIWEALNTSGRAAIGQAVSIKGIGGLGKTQLAVEYAHKFRDRYENGVFWLTADEDIDIQLIKIGEELSWISSSDTGFDQAELVRNRFRKLSGCLIIFDNVNEQETIEEYLLERDDCPHILLTSREKQDFFDEINLHLLKKDESRRLLLKTSKRSIENAEEQKAFEKILDELGDLPLAVELIGGFLAEHPSISFQEYLEFLDEMLLEKLEADFPSISFTRHDKSIIRTLKISEKLFKGKPHLKEILDVLAWSANSSMGYSLLQTLTGIEKNAVLTIALSDLVNLRLINEEQDTKRYTIHRLLAKVRRCEKPLKDRKEWHRKIVGCLESWFRKQDEESKTLSCAEIELEHLEIWQKNTRKYLPSDAVWLTLLKACPLIERGNYREAQKYVEEAYELYKAEKLIDKLLLVNLYKALGNLNINLGSYEEGKSYLEKALDFYKENLINDEKLLAYLMNNLGAAYQNLGNHKRALELFEQALAMRRELFDENHAVIADSLNNLGVAYWNLGNHKKALELFEQALAMRRELFGEKHPETIRTCKNLILTLLETGKKEDAEKLADEFLSYNLPDSYDEWFFERYSKNIEKHRRI